jgi:hypothetical protein
MFGKLDKICWTNMFNVNYIVKPSIMKVALFVDAISKALIFVKLEHMCLLYNCNNLLMLKFLPIPTLFVKNKQINNQKKYFFLYITSSNINLCFSFNCLSKLQYSNSSIIIEYEDFVKFSSLKICNFWFDTLHD